MQTQSYEPEGLVQSNAVLTIYKSAVMAQLAHMTVTVDAMQVQLNTLSSAQTNETRPKRNHYCWSCRINYTHGGGNWSSTKAGHQDEAYYKKRMGGSEKECEWRLGSIFSKIEISNPKISLIDYIDNPPNPTSNNMLAIAYSGANIHLGKQANPTMAPVTMENDTEAIIPDGITMDYSHISTIQLPSPSKQEIKQAIKQCRSIFSQKWRQPHKYH